MADEVKVPVAPIVSAVNEEEKELLRWKSLERPFKVKTREFYSTIVVLAILVGVIFFFIEGIMPVLVVAAILFVIFALSKTPPAMTDHSITNKGVNTGGTKYTWDELVMFWLAKKSGHDVVDILTTRNLPRQLEMVLPEQKAGEEVTPAKIKEIMLKHIPMEQLPPSWVDKATKWLGEKVPLEE